MLKNTISLFNTLLFLCLASFEAQLFAQNVGIGTETPEQKLDVNGNINVAGNLFANSIAGTNGQVLGMNGSTMAWIDKSKYSKFVVYQASGSNSFVVPAGVTELMVEMWGAGGGAHNPGGGGGSGAYIICVLPVTPATALSIVVGTGGLGGNNATPPQSGTSSTINGGGNAITANAGSPGDSIHNTTHTIITYRGGAGGATPSLFPGTILSSFKISGNSGIPTKVTPIVNSAGTRVLLTTGGIGGVAPYTGFTSDEPIFSFDDGTIDYRSGYSIFSKSGSGGSVTAATVFGNTGGAGRIVIYY